MTYRPLPAAVYALIERAPGAVLLESARPHPGAPVSRIFLSPQRTLEVRTPGEVPHVFTEIEEDVSQGRFAAGFFSYECGQAFEPAAGLRTGRADLPLAWFGIYDRMHLFDHQTGAFIGARPDGLDGVEQEQAALQSDFEILSGLDQDRFAESIASIHEWIRAGDVYQLNFTFPLRLRAHGSAGAASPSTTERSSIGVRTAIFSASRRSCSSISSNAAPTAIS
jgi:para-aminobenzoate synthetase/4-amino-4-deoxychorismate lyase